MFLIFNIIWSFHSDDMQFWMSLLHGKRRICQYLILQYTDENMLVFVYATFLFLDLNFRIKMWLLYA
jgi:hypothetical protein